MFRQGSSNSGGSRGGGNDKANKDIKQPSITDFFNKNNLNKDVNNSNTGLNGDIIDLTISSNNNIMMNNTRIGHNSNKTQIGANIIGNNRASAVLPTSLYFSNNKNLTATNVLTSAVKSNKTMNINQSNHIITQQQATTQLSFTQRFGNSSKSIFGNVAAATSGYYSGHGASSFAKNGVYVIEKDKVKKNPLTWPKKPNSSSNENNRMKRSAPWGTGSVKKSILTKDWNANINSEVNKGFGMSSIKNKIEISVTKNMLSPSQLKVIDAIFNKGANVFFTGSAGTGKSFLLHYIIQEIQRQHQFQNDDPFFSDYKSRFPESLAVTASTGIAAFNLGGSTVHSFAGIGLGQGTIEFLVKKVMSSKKSRNKWIKLKWLIIDEISMLDGELFFKLDKIAQSIRGINKPFGGIQLILAGDFFQLPPVSRDKDMKFCFEASNWKDCIHTTIVLKEIFRQKDPTFSTILNQVRLGELTEEAIKIFQSLSRPLPPTKEGIQGAELYPTRYEVEQSNLRRLATLPGKIQSFKAYDFGSDPKQVEKLDNYTLYPKVLELKVNAQVMLLKNRSDSKELVNGSLGVVIGFSKATKAEESKGMAFDTRWSSISSNIGDSEEALYPLVRFSGGREVLITPEETTYEINNKVVAGRIQLPLQLAWALSIHKAQGQTLERVKVDLAKVFEKGQAYVALSRATTLDGLQVLNFRPEKVFAHPKVMRFYKENL